MRKWIPILGALALGLILAMPGAATAQEGRSEFPHGEHVGLFPACTGCHVGVPDGDRPDFYPEPSFCSNCHDGADLDRVSWSPNQSRPSNLTFSHPQHYARTERHGEDLSCASCHQDPGSGRMQNVHPAEAAQCLTCHGHQADQHFQDADCVACHVPLAESGFPLARLEAMQAPADHEAGDFLAQVHGEQAVSEAARCTTCHTQDRCTSCHVNAGSLAEIQAIPVAPATMKLPVSAVHYSTPQTHQNFAWMQSHGMSLNASATDCSTCHTQNDCTSCHIAPAVAAIGTLPDASEVVAPGVGVRRMSPATHQTLGFLIEHGTQAAADDAFCATCHTEESCIECHSGPKSPSYHPTDFVVQHSAAAYGQTMECQNCHSQEQFCRSCHVEQGLGSQGRLGPGYHDGQAAWLFQHGAAARQQLETCASCHTQGECLQCHSQKGAFKINPHGPNFDAERAQQRNGQICLACHLSPPLGGGTP